MTYEIKMSYEIKDCHPQSVAVFYFCMLVFFSPRGVPAAGLPSPLYLVANALWLYCACYIPPHYFCHFATITAVSLSK